MAVVENFGVDSSVGNTTSRSTVVVVDGNDDSSHRNLDTCEFVVKDQPQRLRGYTKGGHDDEFHKVDFFSKLNPMAEEFVPVMNGGNNYALLNNNNFRNGHHNNNNNGAGYTPRRVPCAEGAGNALSLGGAMLGYHPIKVIPSKTAIAPVNPTFLPMADVKAFFETVCGEVHRLRLLGDYQHSTRIAFVEFVMAESSIAALNCSGVIFGSCPIRVSPSKTPVRPRFPIQ